MPRPVVCWTEPEERLASTIKLGADEAHVGKTASFCISADALGAQGGSSRCPLHARGLSSNQTCSC